MNAHSGLTRRTGFTLRELVAVVVVVVVLGGAMFPVLAQPTSQSPMQVCGSKLKEIHRLATLYAGDNQDRIASFNWRSGEITPSQYADLRGPFTDDHYAAAAQAIDILRRRGGRTDIQMIFSWVPSQMYSGLVLEDYAGRSVPTGLFTCPSDRIRTAWQRDPRHYNNQGVPAPDPPGQAISNDNKRWPYSSSFRLPCSVWSADRLDGGRYGWTIDFNWARLRRLGTPPPNAALGQRRMSEVAFPSSKVFCVDEASRHFTPDAIHFSYDNLKQPLLFFDGVVRTEANMYGNRGCDPVYPTLGPSLYEYRPRVWEPALRPPDQGVRLFSQMWSMSTRMGLQGRDFFGAEVYP